MDIELNKLKKSGVSPKDKENLAKLKEYILDAQNKGFQLEDGAKSLLDDYNKLTAQYNANCEKVQALTNTDISSIELGDVDDYLSQINSLSSELFLLERNINIIITKIKTSLKEFDQTKKNITKAKEKFKECKEKCESDMQAVAPRIKELEDKMKDLEKSIPEDIFARYKSIKADKIFPVYVALDNGHCSGCRVEIPTATINKLKNDGMIVCEQCHRIIYNL